MSRRSSTQAERTHRTPFHQILLIIVGSMLLGGSDGIALEEAVGDVLEEGPRRERALETARELDAMPAAIVERLVELHDEFYEVLEDAELERHILRGTLDAMVDHLYQSDLKAMELRFRLADDVTAEEWGEVWEDARAAGDWQP